MLALSIFRVVFGFRLGFRDLCFLIFLLCYAAMHNALMDYAYRIPYYSTKIGILCIGEYRKSRNFRC